MNDKQTNHAQVAESAAARVKQKSRNRPIFIDLMVMLGLTIVSALFIFISLGTTSVPTSYYETQSNGDYIIYDKGSVGIPKELLLYLCGTKGFDGAKIDVGHRDKGTGLNDELGFYVSGQLVVREHTGFKWVRVKLNPEEYQNARELKLLFSKKGMKIGEAVLVDESGKYINLGAGYVGSKHDKEDYKAITDEQLLDPSQSSAFNSMYTSEHDVAETAFELVKGNRLTGYANPPLATELVAIGIHLFGMTPRGWRFMPALFGMLIPAAMYLFAKLLFKKTYLAIIASGLTIVSGIFLTLARIATADVFFVFFMLLSCYFFLRFYRSEISSDPHEFIQSAVSLALSGMMFAFMLALKWSALFFLILPLTLFIFKMISLSRKNKQTASVCVGSDREGETNTETLIYQRRRNWTYGAAAGGYILFSIILYLILYIPTALCGFAYESGEVGYLGHIFANLARIFNETMPAAGSSYAATWLIGMGGETLYGRSPEAVYLMSNPVLVWVGLLSILWFVILWVRGGTSKLYQNNMKALAVIGLGFVATFLPWLFFFRGANIFDFYPALLFLICLITLMIKNVKIKFKHKLFCLHGMQVTVGHTVIAAALLLIVVSFALFAPLSYGAALNSGFFDSMYFFIP